MHVENVTRGWFTEITPPSCRYMTDARPIAAQSDQTPGLFLVVANFIPTYSKLPILSLGRPQPLDHL
jgi:hypothetical protein